MGELLAAIGIRSEVPGPGRLAITNDGDLVPVAPYELVERIRASINVLGPLLTRCGRVRLSMPGGDDFGARPIDMHVAGLEAMGAEFKFSHGEVEATADRLHGADVTFGFPSVGRHREHRHGGRVRRRRDDDRERGAASPRSSTSARCSWRWAPTSPASARHGSSCAASSGLAAAGRPPHGARPHPGRHVPRRRRRRRRRADVRDARPEHMQNLLARFADMGLELTAGPTVAARGGGGPAALDRRADAAVPRHRHRLQAARDHDAERRRRRRASSPRTSTRVASATSRS